MFLAAGLGMFGVAIFHLVTHAFFKALLFLSAGAVIHSLHHEQDMRRMGGLRRELPFTAIVFTIGAATLAGFPLTAGFFSKDEILHGALSRGLESFPWFLLWALGYLTAAGTAFYAFRQVFLVFAGTRAAPHGVLHEGKEEPAHEAPRVMLIPLAVLAFLSVVGGFLAIPSFLEGSSHHGEGQVLGWILGAAAALGGIALARFVYVQRRGLASRIVGSSRFATLFVRASRRRFWVDELYDHAILRPLESLSLVLYYLVDRVLIDWILVAGTGAAARGVGSLLRKVQTGRIPTYALVFLVGVLGALTLAIWAAR
jgi:NADH-quinone oxidoreductase subunit L